MSLTGSRFTERDTTRLHNELVPASVGVVLSSISMYTEAPLVMARIYAPHEYCVKRVKFSQVAEGREARAIDFDLIEMAWGSFEMHTNTFISSSPGNDMMLMTVG